MSIANKRKRTLITPTTNQNNELCLDVLELIFKKLNFLDLANSRLVCSTWSSIAKQVQNFYLPHRKAPFLMIPPQISGHNFSLCDIEDRRNYNLKTNMGFAFSEGSHYHVGSSHGCLIFLNEKLAPFVLNPFTGSRLELPDFTDGERIYALNSMDIDFIHHKIPSHILRLIKGKSPTQSWVRFFIANKLILSANPFRGSRFSAATICSDQHQLAYYTDGQAAWKFLDPENKRYDDVVFDENKLYAVEIEATCVEAWDFSDGYPVKFMKLDLEIPPVLSAPHHVYLVKLSGRILLVTRNVGDKMDDHGNGVMNEERVMYVALHNGEDESDEEEDIGLDHDGEDESDEEEDIGLDHDGEDESDEEEDIGLDHDGEHESNEEEDIGLDHDGEHESDEEEDIGLDHNGEDESDEEVDVGLDDRIMIHNEDDEEEDDEENGLYFQEPPQNYRTVSFNLFELDIEKERVLELKSLEGWAIFLGGDDSTSVSTREEFINLEDGSIYFTDDNWGLMCADSRRGGHDRGIFNVKANNVRVCDDYGFGSTKPSPCWIVADPL